MLKPDKKLDHIERNKGVKIQWWDKDKGRERDVCGRNETERCCSKKGCLEKDYGIFSQLKQKTKSKKLGRRTRTFVHPIHWGLDSHQIPKVLSWPTYEKFKPIKINGPSQMGTPTNSNSKSWTQLIIQTGEFIATKNSSVLFLPSLCQKNDLLWEPDCEKYLSSSGWDGIIFFAILACTRIFFR